MKRTVLVALLLVLFVGAPPARAASGSVVRVRDGVIQGTVAADHREFLGVPFAAPPIGARRFAAPAPVTPWSGTLSTTSAKASCPQALPFVGAVVPSSEDCLYLDVYTPRSVGSSDSSRLPVMVYIYGGAYMLGSSSNYSYTELATQGDAIVVALNYRVGPFGFLGAAGAEGDAGLLDQQAALRWVRANIAAFGGNASNVTIFGESAGGNSVCQQLASPTARGLFDKAITQSGACGSSTLDGQMPAQAQATAVAFGRSVGCSVVSALVACLRGKPQSDLLNAPLAQFTSMKVAFRPVVDGRVVTGSTADVFAAGKQAHVPVLIGGNQDEGRLFVALFQHLATFSRGTDATYRSTLTDLFGAPSSARIHAEYPPSRYGGSADLALSAVYTDGLFACPLARSTSALVQTAPAVYAYEFREQNTPTSGLDPLMPLGAHHAAELTYLGMTPLPVFGAQARLSDRMIADWTTFARTGRPSAAWPAATSGRLQVLATGSPAPEHLSTVATAHDCTFWDGL